MRERGVGIVATTPPRARELGRKDSTLRMVPLITIGFGARLVGVVGSLPG